MNNYEKIKSMSIDEMVNFLLDIADSYWLKEDVEQWLQKECE